MDKHLDVTQLMVHYAFVILVTSVVIGFFTPIFISQEWFKAVGFLKQAFFLSVFYGVGNIVLLPLFNKIFKSMSGDVFKSLSIYRARQVVKEQLKKKRNGKVLLNV